MKKSVVSPILQKVWVTKYALTSGVIIAEGEVDSGGVRIPRGANYDFYFGNDFQLTESDAIFRFNERKEKKLASLKKQLSKLEKLEWGK